MLNGIIIQLSSQSSAALGSSCLKLLKIAIPDKQYETQCEQLQIDEIEMNEYV